MGDLHRARRCRGYGRLQLLLAEGAGTFLLVAVVVGSGIAAQDMTHDPALQLLCNSVATGAGLVALILTFGSISASFNPVVSVVHGTSRRLAALAPLFAVQIVGAVLGAIAANVMFDGPVVKFSTHGRMSAAHLFAEVVATFGLIVVIAGAKRGDHLERVAVAVAGYITAAYWFTSSTSFANPAVTIGRMFSDTYAGISPSSVLPFIGAQVVGALLAAFFIRIVFEEI